MSDNNATWLSELDVVLLSGFHEELYAWIRSEFACYRATKFRFYFSTTGAHFSPNLFLSQSSTGDVPRLSSTFLSCNFFFFSLKSPVCLLANMLRAKLRGV